MAVYRNQTGEIIQNTTDRMREEVVKGLLSTPKYLNSKYFYDAEGDKLFQQIMDLPEYYLSRSEMEIFKDQSTAIAKTILSGATEVDIVELGAGDAIKSTHLLKQLSEQQIDFSYYPIDISDNVIQLLEQQIPARVPGIKMHGLNGEYLDMVEYANLLSPHRKVYLFLGSNIGNFRKSFAIEFLKKLQTQMKSGDLLLIGLDLKKNPKQILAAYNDDAGITKAFNLNLLKRIKRELDVDLDLAQFEHYPTYDPISGSCRSYIISLEKQSVLIDNECITFEKNEPIYMELSQKYSVSEIDALAEQTGFKPLEYFFDSNKWFLDVVWEKE